MKSIIPEAVQISHNPDFENEEFILQIVSDWDECWNYINLHIADCVSVSSDREHEIYVNKRAVQYFNIVDKKIYTCPGCGEKTEMMLIPEYPYCTKCELKHKKTFKACILELKLWVFFQLLVWGFIKKDFVKFE